MAVVSARTTLRMDEFDFNRIYALPMRTTSNISGTTLDGVVYQDSLTIADLGSTMSEYQSLFINGSIYTHDINYPTLSGMIVNNISQILGLEMMPNDQTSLWSISDLDYYSNYSGPDGTGAISTALSTSIGTSSTVDDYILIASLLSGDDTVTGSSGDDVLLSYAGDDTIDGGDGNDIIDGGDGVDTVIQFDDISSYRIGVNGNHTIVSILGNTQLLSNVEILQFNNVDYNIDDLEIDGLVGELMASREDGQDSWEMPEDYVGDVSYLDYQMLGTALSNVMGGTTRDDFFNLLEGDDAVDAGLGDDVLDGGTGSNFLTGGAGRDVFFLDGRGAASGSGGVPTWSTITDWGMGEEVSIWGWEVGSSTSTWAAFEGVGDYRGVTLHVDFDDDGTIDASVTWTGKAQSELPTPNSDFADLLWFQSPTVV